MTPSTIRFLSSGGVLRIARQDTAPFAQILPRALLVAVAALVLVTLICDLVALARRSSAHHSSPGGTQVPHSFMPHASALLPPVLLQLLIAALAVLFPLTTSRAFDDAIAYLVLAGAVFFVALSAGLGLWHLSRERRLLLAEQPRAPSLPPPPSAPHGVYTLTYGWSLADNVLLLVYTCLGFFLAVDLLPWLLSELPDPFGLKTALGIHGLPGTFSQVLDGVLLVCGVIGLGTLLAGLVALFSRTTLRANPGGLTLRFGPIRRSIPWIQARTLLVRLHRGSGVSYQLIGSGPRDVITWRDRPDARARHGALVADALPVSSRQLAAVAARYAKLAPTVLDPRTTEAAREQYVRAAAGRMARDMRR